MCAVTRCAAAALPLLRRGPPRGLPGNFAQARVRRASRCEEPQAATHKAAHMRGGNTKLRYGATNGKTGAANSVAKAIVRARPPSACACAQRRAATYVCVLSGLGGRRAHAPAGLVAARASLLCSAPARRAVRSAPAGPGGTATGSADSCQSPGYVRPTRARAPTRALNAGPPPEAGADRRRPRRRTGARTRPGRWSSAPAWGAPARRLSR